MSLKPLVSAVFFLLLLSGCDRGDDGTPTSHPAVATDGTPGHAILTADPASVDGCGADKHRRAMLHWDVSAAGAHAVVLTVVNPKDGSEKRFGHGGAVGEKQTGPWLRPGVVFKVHEQPGNAVLASAVIGGTPCVRARASRT